MGGWWRRGPSESKRGCGKKCRLGVIYSTFKTKLTQPNAESVAMKNIMRMWILVHIFTLRELSQNPRSQL